jgi:hypothetical protein
MEASRSEKNHFVPGYDHAVPLGQMDSRAEALIKLALIGFSLGLPPKKRVRPHKALPRSALLEKHRFAGLEVLKGRQKPGYVHYASPRR